MAYAFAVIRYRRPIEEVTLHTDAHRAYLKSLKEKGVLLVSGPFVPRFGGGLLLRIPDTDTLATLDRIRDNDPYIQQNVAQYEIHVWDPGIGRESLDQL
jgi:uncharacterized protein YciI